MDDLGEEIDVSELDFVHETRLQIAGRVDALREVVRNGVLLNEERVRAEEEIRKLAFWVRLAQAHAQLSSNPPPLDNRQHLGVLRYFMLDLDLGNEFTYTMVDQHGHLVDHTHNNESFHLEHGTVHSNASEDRWVRRATWNVAGEQRDVVVKRISKNVLAQFSMPDQNRLIQVLRREFVVQIVLQNLPHPNIQSFIPGRYYENQQDILVVFRGADESLDAFCARGVVDPVVLVPIMLQMSKAVLYFARLGFVHRDLKLENFVITHESGLVELIDFGLSASLCINPETGLWNSMKGLVGTARFMAPEVFQNLEHDPIKAEIWSLGVCFFTLLSGGQGPYTMPGFNDKCFRYLYVHGAEAQLKAYLGQYNVPINENMQRCITLVAMMLRPNAPTRITLTDVTETLEAIQQDILQ